MGATIKYLVPYELRVNASDLSSGKPISNLFYVKSGYQAVSPPAYGDPVPGPSDTATLLASFNTVWLAQVVTLMSVQYKMVEYVLRSILGYKYGTPFVPLVSVAPGVVTSFATSVAHGLTSGQIVNITSVTGTIGPAVIGFGAVTVTGTNTFTMAINTTGLVYAGGGSVQLAQGGLSWLYGDQEILANTTAGSVSGDALPLFSDASVRRIGSFTGKSFQGRNSLAPIAESQQKDGKFESAAVTAWTAALSTLVGTSFNNGGSDVSSGASALVNVSKKIAFTKVSPFTSSIAFTTFCTSMLLRPNLGSFVRRKPRLNAVLT